VNAVVQRPLPYSHSDRLVWLAESIPALKSEAATGGDYVDWKDQNHTLDRIAAYDTIYRDSLREGSGSGGGSAAFNLTGRGTPARVHGAFVSASFFATLGVEPQLGRAFTENEDQPSGPHVVVLMHFFWQQYFGSDAHVLGQRVNLDAAPYTVIGVMPASFRFPGDSDAQILVPLALNQARERLRIAQRQVRIIGRLKPGVSLAAARADLDEIHKRAQPSNGPMMVGTHDGPGAAPTGPAAAGQGGTLGMTTSGPSPAAPKGSGHYMLPPEGAPPKGRAPAMHEGEASSSQVARAGAP